MYLTQHKDVRKYKVLEINLVPYLMQYIILEVFNMVKTVVSNKEITHLWGKQEYAKGSNCHFEGNLFYSYGAEIGAFRTNNKGEEAVFIDRSNYSNTTSRHQSNLEWAVNHITKFTYTCNTNSRYNRYLNITPSTVTPDWLYAHYLEQATELTGKSERARVPERKLYYIEEAKRYLNRANSVVDWFEANHLDKIDETQYDELLTKLSSEAEEVRKKEKERVVAALKLNYEYYLPQLNYWLIGHIGVSFPTVYHNKGIYLRLLDDTVETSRGAKFPASSCETLFKLYQRCVESDIIFSNFIQVGYYTVTHVSKKGIIAGCHHIKPNEINRFARVLGLTT